MGCRSKVDQRNGTPREETTRAVNDSCSLKYLLWGLFLLANIKMLCKNNEVNIIEVYLRLIASAFPGKISFVRFFAPPSFFRQTKTSFLGKILVGPSSRWKVSDSLLAKRIEHTYFPSNSLAALETTADVSSVSPSIFAIVFLAAGYQLLVGKSMFHSR